MIQVRKLRTAEDFKAHVASLGVDIPFDDDVVTDGLRFAILPMEGWDGTDDGRPTDLVLRRWQRFGTSGAHMVWGGEAVAVTTDGRANPHQLVIGPWVADLRAQLGDSQLTGLQLTHSGRWSYAEALCGRPDRLLDARRPGRLLTDDELDRLVDDFAAAALIARNAGFDFVDVKACHGYLGHELLGAVDRPGRYGGDFEGRTRFLRSCIEAVQAAAPGLDVGVRFSAFDVVPHHARESDGVGEPDDPSATSFGFDEGEALLDLLEGNGVTLVCITAGSPYYCPHAQRPAFFPPSDGYLPPEDPLIGVARLLDVTARLKRHRPEMTVVGTGYSYLQEWLPNVASAAVRTGAVDYVGLGRMALSYPDLPADVLAGRPLDRRRICRTFSDCTTAPRNGLVSGCWPLDPEYKLRPDRPVLAEAKRRARFSVADS